MGFFDSFNKALKDGVDDYKNTVNKVVGSSYQNIYFNRYPNGPYICKGCGRSFPERDRDCTVDHIVPQKCGGTNAITNLQILCRSCNSSKNAQLNMLSIKYSGAALLRELKKVIRY